MQLSHVYRPFRRVAVFELSTFNAAPGMGTLRRLEEAVIETFGDGVMCLAGVEAVPIDEGGPPVGVAQQWRVALVTTKKDGGSSR